MATFILILMILAIAAATASLITLGFLRVEGLLSRVINVPLLPQDPGAAIVAMGALITFIVTSVILYHAPQPRTTVDNILNLFMPQIATAANEGNLSCPHNNLDLSLNPKVIETTPDGTRIITISSEKYEAIAWTDINDTVTEFTLEVVTFYECGSGNYEYGLVVRKGHQHNFYQFTLANDVFFAKQNENGKWATLRILPVSAMINPPGQGNRLKLVVTTDQLWFYINDNPLAKLNHSDFIIGGAGLVVATRHQGEAKVAFDNLTIY